MLAYLNYECQKLKPVSLGHSENSSPYQYNFMHILRPVKLLFVVFGRLSYSFFMDVKRKLSVHAV